MEKPKRTGKMPLVATGYYMSLTKRHLREETLKFFGYQIADIDAGTCHVAPYYNEDGKLVAQKLRFAGKKFAIAGDASEMLLFGQNKWKAGGKRLVITEGEIDALSYAQATSCSWPVVSVPNGAQSAPKAIRKSIKFVEAFDEVVFMFDNDEPGRQAAVECAKILSPGKAKIAQLPLKDANEMLVAGRIKEMQQAVWNAKEYRPDGIINGKELWEEVSKPIVMGMEYPWEGLNDVLYGLRPSEIVTLAAGSGIGKSTISAEIAYHIGVHHKQNIGYVALEESPGRSALRLMGMHVNAPLHLPGVTVSPEQRKEAFEQTLGTGRFYFYDHFGSLDSDELLGNLSYLVKGLDCRWLVLDHLSIVVSGMSVEGDERRVLDYTMTRLRQFTEETGAGLILVTHLKRPEGKGHEDGALTSLSQLRGSAAIGQLSDAVIGIERNSSADDPEERNKVRLRVLKNRYAGKTGPACELQYIADTGRLVPVDGEQSTGESDDFDDDQPDI